MEETHAETVIDIGLLRRSCAACALRQLCLPAGINGTDLSRLEEVVKARRPLERGEILFDLGMPLQSLYVVRSGALKTFSRDENGDAQILGFHLPGEIIGFDALADDRHQCAAEALSRARVCEVPFNSLQQIAASVPGFQRQLLRVVSREVLKDHEHLVMMGRRQAMERLAIFVHSLAARYRRLGFSGDEFILPMSRYELANYLGLVVETVSRLFSRLAEMKVLKVSRKTIQVLDMKRLENLSHEADGDEQLRAAR